MPELVERMGNNGTQLQVIVAAALPRTSETGYPDERGEMIEQLGTLLASRLHGLEWYRVLWSQAVAVVPLDHEPVAETAHKIAADLASAIVELTTLVIDVRGSKDVDWIDDALGDFSTKRKFGEFRPDDRITRAIDGRTHDLPKRPANT